MGSVSGLRLPRVLSCSTCLSPSIVAGPLVIWVCRPAGLMLRLFLVLRPLNPSDRIAVSTYLRSLRSDPSLIATDRTRDILVASGRSSDNETSLASA